MQRISRQLESIRWGLHAYTGGELRRLIGELFELWLFGNNVPPDEFDPDGLEDH
jgi:hypothetical protein